MSELHRPSLIIISTRIALISTFLTGCSIPISESSPADLFASPSTPAVETLNSLSDIPTTTPSPEATVEPTTPPTAEPTVIPSPTTEPTPEIDPALLACLTTFSEWESAPEAPYDIIMSDAQTKAIVEAGLLKPMDKSVRVPFPAEEFNSGVMPELSYSYHESFLQQARENIAARPMHVICMKKVSNLDAFVVFMQVATDDPSVKDGHVLLRVFFYDLRKLEHPAYRDIKVGNFNRRTQTVDEAGDAFINIFYDVNIDLMLKYPTANNIQGVHVLNLLLAQPGSENTNSGATVKRIMSGRARASDEHTPFVGDNFMFY